MVRGPKYNIQLTADQCGQCAFYWMTGACKAFPGGIPNEILRGEKQHNKKIEGQFTNAVFINVNSPEAKGVDKFMSDDEMAEYADRMAGGDGAPIV